MARGFVEGRQRPARTDKVQHMQLNTEIQVLFRNRLLPKSHADLSQTGTPGPTGYENVLRLF
jgi:hypothetical protein